MSTAVVNLQPSTGISPLKFLKLRPDFVALAIALPIFIAASWPLLAWGVVALVWTAQAVIQIGLDAKVAGSDDPRRVIGLLAGGALARGWAVATVLLILGLVADDAVLYAIVLTMVVFTVYFIAKVFNRLTNESDAVVRAAAKEADKS